MNTAVAYLLNVLSDLLQVTGYILGMYAIAKVVLKARPFVVSVLACTTIVYAMRALDLVPFGVHTLLSMLIINVACVLICGMEVRPSVLASIIMMVLVLVGELVDVGVLVLLGTPMDQINALLNGNALIKALASFPGNIIMGIAVFIAYRKRVSTKR